MSYINVGTSTDKLEITFAATPSPNTQYYVVLYLPLYRGVYIILWTISPILISRLKYVQTVLQMHPVNILYLRRSLLRYLSIIIIITYCSHLTMFVIQAYCLYRYIETFSVFDISSVEDQQCTTMTRGVGAGGRGEGESLRVGEHRRRVFCFHTFFVYF